MILSEEIKRSIQQFSSEKQQQILQQVLKLSVSQSEQLKLNQQYQSMVINAFKNIMKAENINDLCSLLNFVWKSLKNNMISKDVLIKLLDSILECVRVEDLKKILAIVRERLDQIGQLQSKISFSFLRIINTLLKRISKSTDFQIRGELHLTITKIINFCHQSGFQYRQGNVQTNDKIQVQESLLNNLKQSSISIQFYQNFWEMQKYFMDIHELIKVGQNQAVATPAKQDLKLMGIRLKKLQFILEETINYFKINPPNQNKDFLSFPLKFIKLPNLLKIQLQDSYFRLVILVQALIFCSSLTVFPAKHQMILTTQSKQTVKRIQSKTKDYLDQLIKLRSDCDALIKSLNSFFDNDVYWIQLKDNWRQKKKTFFKNLKDEHNQIKKSTSLTQSQNLPVNNQPVPASATVNQQLNAKKSPNLAEVDKKCKKQILRKIQIKPNFIQKFLNHVQAPVLKKQPICPSFQFYYSQARHCLQTFDEKQQCQTQFETRSQYNLFQWKAFRSLQRERIITNVDTDKNSKLSDYKLLDFIKKKQQVFEGSEPRKRVKLSQQQRRQQ